MTAYKLNIYIDDDLTHDDGVWMTTEDEIENRDTAKRIGDRLQEETPMAKDFEIVETDT